MATSVSTLEGYRTELSDESINELSSKIRGAVLMPSDAGYDKVRAPYNAMQSDRAALIVQCTGTADVVDAVNFGRENGIEVTVRGGGHSVAGLSTSDGGS